MNIKKKLSYYCILSSIFCIILGTLLHFTYEWFNLNKFVGFFSATNESTWEHLKLIFFPMVFSTLIALMVNELLCFEKRIQTKRCFWGK